MTMRGNREAINDGRPRCRNVEGHFVSIPLFGGVARSEGVVASFVRMHASKRESIVRMRDQRSGRRGNHPALRVPLQRGE